VSPSEGFPVSLLPDRIAPLVDAGYVVDEAIPASDELEAIYVVSKGSPAGHVDPTVPSDYVVTYGTEETLAALARELGL